MLNAHPGRTGLKVNRLCLGAMNCGPESDEATSFAIMDRALDQLDGSLRALQLALSDQAIGQRDAIFPGPGGPAPEAYAW